MPVVTRLLTIVSNGLKACRIYAEMVLRTNGRFSVSASILLLHFFCCVRTMFLPECNSRWKYLNICILKNLLTHRPIGIFLHKKKKLWQPVTHLINLMYLFLFGSAGMGSCVMQSKEPFHLFQVIGMVEYFSNLKIVYEKFVFKWHFDDFKKVCMANCYVNIVECNPCW